MIKFIRAAKVGYLASEIHDLAYWHFMSVYAVGVDRAWQRPCLRYVMRQGFARVEFSVKSPTTDQPMMVQASFVDDRAVNVL